MLVCDKVLINETFIDRDLASQYCGFDKLALCCDVEFPACHWIGQGTCDDNECAEYVSPMASPVN